MWRVIRGPVEKKVEQAADKAFTSKAYSTQKFYQGGFLPKMTREEALKILEVKYVTPCMCELSCPFVRDSATRADIMTRYRQLVKINHPDRGGSALIALKINEAKELMVSTLKKS